MDVTVPTGLVRATLTLVPAAVYNMLSVLSCIAVRDLIILKIALAP